jgi:hypothetical protein
MHLCTKGLMAAQIRKPGSWQITWVRVGRAAEGPGGGPPLGRGRMEAAGAPPFRSYSTHLRVRQQYRDGVTHSRQVGCMVSMTHPCKTGDMIIADQTICYCRYVGNGGCKMKRAHGAGHMPGKHARPAAHRPQHVPGQQSWARLQPLSTGHHLAAACTCCRCAAPAATIPRPTGATFTWTLVAYPTAGGWPSMTCMCRSAQSNVLQGGRP